MFSRRLTIFFVIGTLIAVAGCDPETLIRTKTPPELQKLLGALPSEAEKKAEIQKRLKLIKVEIASPADNAFCPLERVVSFRAQLDAKGFPIEDKSLVWTLTREKEKPQQVGLGRVIEKKINQGSYTVELTLSLDKDTNISRKRAFKVGPSITGKVLHGAKGMPNADVELREPQGDKMVSQAKTLPDGTFYIAVPEKGLFKLAPLLAGHSFEPAVRMVQRDPPPKKVEFKAVKAEIKEILLYGAEKADAPLQKICPDQGGYAKVRLSSEAPPANIKVFLFPLVAEVRDPILIGEATFSPDSAGKTDPSESFTVKAAMPEELGKGSKEISYRLGITVGDTNGISFSGLGKQNLTLDMTECILATLSQALAAQEAGRPEQAIKLYDRVEALHSNLGDPAALSAQLEKTNFNEALAYVGLALALDPTDLKRQGYLTKALADLREVVKYHSRDAQAFLFTGLILQLRGEYEAAMDSYASAIAFGPQQAEAFEMRSRAYLELGLKKHLSRAVDDLTQALSINPGDESLRNTRKAVLNLEVKHVRDSEEAKVDLSSAPLPNITDRLKLGGYLRK
jgi:tetratricopeptide (TPR) repeat protein